MEKEKHNISEVDVQIGNKLIAEFMGLKYKHSLFSEKSFCPGYYDKDDKLIATSAENLKYHKSWDSLMPVFEKIVQEELYYRNDSYTEEGIVLYNIISDTIGDCEGIEAVHKDIVYFIKWYTGSHSQKLSF